MGRKLYQAIKQPCYWNREDAGQGGNQKALRLGAIQLNPASAGQLEQREMEKI